MRPDDLGLRVRPVDDEHVDSQSGAKGALGVLAGQAKQIGPVTTTPTLVKLKNVRQKIGHPRQRLERLPNKGPIESQELTAELNNTRAIRKGDHRPS